MKPKNNKPKFKIEFDKYHHRFNLGFNFCYAKYDFRNADCYAIFHFGKYYLAIGRMG